VSFGVLDLELNIAVNGGEEKPNIPGYGLNNGILASARLKTATL
jgi:hypothetical protein